MDKKISICIQGPINRSPKNLRKTLINYYNKYQIVVSCWKTCDTNWILQEFPNVKVIQNQIPNINIDSNLPYQILSSLNGIKLIDTDLCIKIRSDETFNLNNLIEQGLNNTSKITVVNIFFIPPELGKFNTYYHISDHCWFGRTDILRKGLEIALKDLNMYYQIRLGIEGYLGLSFLKALNFCVINYLDIDFCKRMLKQNFQVVDIDKLNPYSWSCSNIFYQNSDYLYNNGYNKSIRSMEEL